MVSAEARLSAFRRVAVIVNREMNQLGNTIKRLVSRKGGGMNRRVRKEKKNNVYRCEGGRKSRVRVNVCIWMREGEPGEDKKNRR